MNARSFPWYVGLVAVGIGLGCRQILDIDEDRPLLGGGGTSGTTEVTTSATVTGSASSATDATSTTAGGTTGTEASSGATSGSTTGGDPEWPAWPLTPDGAPTANYDVDADTVTDLTTGLMWMGVEPGPTVNFAGAQTFCADLVLGGFDDWRLPTRIEIVTLVTFEFDATAAVNTQVFPELIGGLLTFWTSSRYVRGGVSNERWSFSTTSGSPGHTAEVDSARSFCVRGPV